MKTSNLKFTIIVCVFLIIMHTIFMANPFGLIRLYNLVLRPLAYAVIAVAIYVFIEIDSRPIRNAYGANMFTIVSVSILGIAILTLSLLFGASTNSVILNTPFLLRSLWQFGVVLIMGEFIRYKLIKSAEYKNRDLIISMITIILAYSQMNDLNLLINENGIVWVVFFDSIFKPLTISVAVSYFAIKGNFFSIVIFSFIYSMAPYISPIIPNVSIIVFSLITSGLVFVLIIAYHIIFSEQSREQKQHEKRAAKYEKKSLMGYAVMAFIIILLAAFFKGTFPIYPIVILTDSMSGTFERGSIVFVEKIPNSEVLYNVGEGDILHYYNRNKREYVHRVIGLNHDSEGKRQYITKGDASELADTFPVPQDDVLGIVRSFIPYIGYPYLLFWEMFIS